MLLESEAIAKITNPNNQKQVTELMDSYAIIFDKILKFHRDNLSADIKQLTISLQEDLEKLETTSSEANDN